MNIKTEIFNNYGSLQCKQNEPSDLILKERFFVKYVDLNILPFISINKDIKILEIGCGKGFLLNALYYRGYTNITGLDLSPEEIQFAKTHFNLNVQQCDFLKQKIIEKYDLIICRAVIEHLAKSEIGDFINKIKSITKANGQIIISVPNMDWQFAIHERYMDYTHEIGFTHGSLLEILKIYFSNISILPEKQIYLKKIILKKILSWFRDIQLAILLYSYDVNIKDYWISSNAIIAYIKK